MSTVMAEATNEANTAAFQWNWRRAQQAFAELVGTRRTGTSMNTARATQLLSALSADERPAFDRWLALQLAARNDIVVARGLRNLAAVDGMLAAAVRRQLPVVTADLSLHPAIAVAA